MHVVQPDKCSVTVDHSFMSFMMLGYIFQLFSLLLLYSHSVQWFKPGLHQHWAKSIQQIGMPWKRSTDVLTTRHQTEQQKKKISRWWQIHCEGYEVKPKNNSQCHRQQPPHGMGECIANSVFVELWEQKYYGYSSRCKSVISSKNQNAGLLL